MNNNYYAQLKAGSEVVTMRSMSPYLFEVVVKICQNLGEEQAKEAIQLYMQVFIDRFSHMVVDHSNQTAAGIAQAEDFSSSVAKKLTNLEREVFDLHRRQKGKFILWKNRQGLAIDVNPEFV